MKKYLVYYIAICLIGFLIFLIFFLKPLSQRDFYDQVVNSVLQEEYIGSVIDKYIDKNEHNFKKLVIDQNGQHKTILLNFESIQLFDFIKVGDTLVKKKNLLQLEIKRKNLDTIIPLKFENVKGHEKYSNGTE